MSDDKRLQRIEDKLDQMSEAIVSLARMEERMITLFKRIDKYDDKQHDIEDRVTALEKETGTHGQFWRFAERLFWILVTAGVTYLVMR